MTADKQKLRALAEAATPEQWDCRPGGEYWAVVSPRHEVARVELPFKASAAQEQADARFIAAANPIMVLALLDEIAQLTKENANLREDRDGLLEAGAHLL